MPIGVRELTALREFKPFGLTVEETDGDPPEGSQENYNYFLFSPEICREGSDPFDANLDFSDPVPASDLSDHEIFIRGNRIIWSTGSRVNKRYMSPSSVTMACWCRMDNIADALLCVLQVDTLSIYNASGEVVCIPLPYSIASIWPLQCGLLLQKSSDGSRMMSLSCSPLNARDLSRPCKEYGLNYSASCQASSFEPIFKDNGSIISSHLILTHPLEEPQAMYSEDRGKVSTMKDFEEKTIWTSDCIPLMASYHKGKSQHSLWYLNAALRSGDNSSPSTLSNDLSARQFSFRRIWLGKISLSAATKVFLATDIDGTPIICFFLHEQKKLLAVSLTLQTNDAEGDDFVDIRPHTSWTVPGIATSPVVVTRPRARVGQLPFTDIIVLGSDNHLLLYSGKQCLCKYVLPIFLEKGFVSHGQHSFSLRPTDLGDGLKITNIGDAVDGQINVTCNNNQILRCSLHRKPSSSLVNDCITAMAEGLHISYYSHFVALFWGNCDSAYLSSSITAFDSEWESFADQILKICSIYGSTPKKQTSTVPNSSWEFLKNSKFHIRYSKQPSASCISILRVPASISTQNQIADIHDDDHSQETLFYAQLLGQTLDSLHALYENLKLSTLRKLDAGYLALLLSNIAACLGEPSYVDYYRREFPSVLVEVHSLPNAVVPRIPPCLFHWLESSLQKGLDLVDRNDIPPLLCQARCPALSWARKVLSFYSLLLGAERKGRKLSSGVYCDVADGSARTSEELTVLAMVAEKFGRQQLDLLPVGVSLPLRHALDKCRESPPADWPASAYVLVGREDLAMSKLGCSRHGNETQKNADLISISVPYMLHLKCVTVPSSASEITKVEPSNSEDLDSLNRSEDGMEHIFNSSTQLRYGRDLRLSEARRLLCSARPVAIQMSVNPSVTDQDLQQHQLWNLAQRTTALPFGRGAFTLSTTYTLLTEALVVPKLVLAGRLPAQQNATVNLDPNLPSVSELRAWPEFHNGVAAGLMLAPFQGKMSRTWIQYNKPEEPNFTHAGLLLAIGLHEHLRVLTITDVYRYLSQEHEATMVGLMLGIAASHRGTMHPAISKMLYLHIPSRHLSSFPDLELPTLVQTTALMAIGLLYEGSEHPMTLKILLGEIGRLSGGDNVLEREGYAFAAGSALGLVALGRGADAFGFMDTFVDRLFRYISCKGAQNDKSSNSARHTDDQNRNVGQIIEGAPTNVDVTAPGAIIALALIFLKTESEVIAARLHIPTTHFGLQYVRPDFIMLRIIARNLILWNRIQPSRDWVESQVPEIVRVGILKLRDGAIESDDYDTEALYQAYVNIVTGACIALGLKYAGTKNDDVQELLYCYTLYFLNEIKHIPLSGSSMLPKGLLQYVDRSTLETCLHLIVLSLCLVMAGSGHLRTFRLLRYLRGRSSAEGHINYGIQMAVSLAIGFLFLSGGMQTFSTGNSAVAALLITLYPRLPTGPNDNRCHLQAFRHLYVIAAESRWVQTADVDTGLPVYCPLEITVKETDFHGETSYYEVTPCILPERSVLKSIGVCGPRYWPQFIQLAPEDKPWWRSGDNCDPLNGGLIYIKRKVGSCSYEDDPVGCQFLLSRAMHKIHDTEWLCSSTQGISSLGHSSFKIDQLVSTFSADPSLIAFAKLCSDSSWNSRYAANFQEFCLQVLFECVSNDRPALLQVYIWLYTTIESMWEQVNSGLHVFHDSLFLSSLKLVLAYNDALVSGKLGCASRGIIQPTFTASLRVRVEDILDVSKSLEGSLHRYLETGEWPDTVHGNGDGMDAELLSWYLLWYGIPPPHVVASAVDRIKLKAPASPLHHLSMVPLLHLLLPMTHAKGILDIDRFCFCSRS